MNNNNMYNINNINNMNNIDNMNKFPEKSLENSANIINGLYDGLTYDRFHILDWFFKGKKTSPLTNLNLNNL